MKPEEVPDDLVEKACRARWDAVESRFSGYNGDVAHTWPELVRLFPAQAENQRAEVRVILAATLPSYKQRVTAKYRRFVKAVRVITRGGEAYQTPKSQGGGGDECTISPPELRQALTDLRHGRQ